MLRKNLLDYVLPVCKAITAGTSADSIFVAKKKGALLKVYPRCSPVPDDNDDGWPDNLEAWREYRIAHGGSIQAYIYSPVTQLGEFFVYDAEDSSTFHLHKANGELWQNSYDVDENPRVYMIDQRCYALGGDILQCVINGDTAGALNLVSHIKDFRTRAFFRDGWLAARGVEMIENVEGDAPAPESGRLPWKRVPTTP